MKYLLIFSLCLILILILNYVDSGYIYVGITVFYVIAMAFLLVKSSMPSKKIVEKFGKPIAHFTTSNWWGGLQLRDSLDMIIDMDFYPEFIVISGFYDEIILTKESKNIKLHGGFLNLNSIFEIELSYGVVKCSVTYRQRNLIKKFFNIY